MIELQMSVLILVGVFIIGQLYKLSTTMRNISKQLTEQKQDASKTLENQSRLLKIAERLEGPISRLDSKN